MSTLLLKIYLKVENKNTFTVTLLLCSKR